MTATYPTISEPATPEYVLAVLQDLYRHAANNDACVDSKYQLTMKTTIEQWCAAMGDEPDWQALGHWMNIQWNIQLSNDIWKFVLTPMHRRTLRDLCVVIAQHARQPLIRPALLLGHDCTTAGVFLTIRSILQQAGADVTQLSPSTPLADYTRRYDQVFLQYISPLAPGALPAIRVKYPFYANPIWGIFLGLLLMGIGTYLPGGVPVLIVLGAIILILSLMLNWLAIGWRLPTSVEFGELKTFRDLSRVIATGSRNAA